MEADSHTEERILRHAITILLVLTTPIFQLPSLFLIMGFLLMDHQDQLLIIVLGSTQHIRIQPMNLLETHVGRQVRLQGV